MKKRRVFAVISAMVLSVSMLFTTGITAKAEESNVATLTVSETGYEAISGMYGDTVVAEKSGKYGMAKQDGAEVVPFEYDECKLFDRKSGICVLSKFVRKYEYGLEYWLEYDHFIYDNSGKLLYKYTGVMDDQMTVTDLGDVFIYANRRVTPFSWVCIDSATGEVINKVDEYEEAKKTGWQSDVLMVSNGKYIIRKTNYNEKNNRDDDVVKYYLYDGDREIELVNAGEYGNPFFANGDYIFWSKSDSRYNYPRNIDVYCYQISTGKYYKINSYHMESVEDDKSFGTVGNNIMMSNAGQSLYALYDINGNAITEEKYTSIEGTAEIKDYYLVSDSNNKWFYIDSKGKEYGTELKDAGSFYGGHAIVLNNDGEAYIIDESFEKVSESVKADGVTSYNNDLFSITVDGLKYPVVMNKKANTGTGVYEVNVTADKAISATDFTTLLTENQTKDVVIKSNSDITFTFAKGTMKAVEGKDSYDFSAVINKDYDTVTGLPADVTKDNFISQIEYKYSGQLPAEASIRIPVGKDYAGKTLYYSRLSDDGSISLVSTVVVDDEGYITVKQSHCSSYILTSAKTAETGDDTLSGDNTTDQNEAPNTGDNTNIMMFVLLGVLSLGVMVIISRRIRVQL